MIEKLLAFHGTTEFAASYLKGCSNILDVGCGMVGIRNERPLSELLDNVTTLDIDEGKGPDIVASILKMPIDDESYDGVNCTSVLEHVRGDLGTAISELCRVLETDGRLVITVPPTWNGRIDRHEDHVRKFYDTREIEKHLKGKINYRAERRVWVKGAWLQGTIGQLLGRGEFVIYGEKL